MAEIVTTNDLSFTVNAEDGCGTLRQHGGGEVIVSPEEAIRIGIALRAWGEAMVEVEATDAK